MIKNAEMATYDELEVPDPDGLTSVVLRWTPAGPPRAVVQVLHGWAEHALRYDRPATAMAKAGLAVYADDHRGHGQSGLRADRLGDLGPRGTDGVLDAIRAVTGRVRPTTPACRCSSSGTAGARSSCRPTCASRRPAWPAPC